jgi:hypothetical protein
MSGVASRSRRAQLARVGRLAVALVGAACLALLASACGGSSGEGVAQADSSGSSKRQALLAFAACMRKNGVPNFPDPQDSGGGARLSFDPNTPGFANAQRRCKRLLPNGGAPTRQQQREQLQKALDYAACMRRRGVPNFPDPKASGDGGIEWGELGPRVGIDPDSPQFTAAEEACKELAPGAKGDDTKSSDGP